MAVGDCEPTMSADGFTVVGWHCELAMGLGTVARFGVIAARFFVASVSEIDG
jgi:hypothetical protein